MNEPTQTEPAADAAGARVDRAVGRPDPERARTCKQGCNGCDECTDWPDYDEDAPDEDCTRCHGDGTDPWADHLLPCPECQGEKRA